MLRFANPEFFQLYWLIPLLALFLIWAFRYRRRLLRQLGDEELIAQLTANLSRRKQHWKSVLILLALCFLILGLTDPQIGTHLAEVKREGIDIFIAVDVSKSMLAEDVAPNRLEKAKHEIGRFINGLQGDRVGLIAFAGLAFVQCPLTLDYSAAQLFLDEIDVNTIPQPGTAIADAINTARRSFVKKDLKHKVLILITDGENHEGDPFEAAEEASREGIIIHTIGIGSPQGAPIPEYDRYGNRTGYKKDRQGRVVTTRLDIETLETIAQKTGGRFFFSGPGGTDLSEIFDEISQMEKKELASREFTQFEDRFQIFLFLAMALLVIEAVMSERRRKKRGRA